MKTDGRYIWAASLLDVKPTDHLLEIGCGVGLLVEQVAPKLISGIITAVDQSAPMITRATKRNQSFITSGKVALVVGKFADCLFLEAGFDKILAFNVNFFWKDPKKELYLIKEYLKPNGKLFILYQTPNNSGLKLAELIESHLHNHSFRLINYCTYQIPNSNAAFCIVTQPIA